MSSRSFLYFSSFDLFVLSFYTCYNYSVGLLQIVFLVLNQGFDYRPILKWLTINWHGFNSSEIQERKKTLITSSLEFGQELKILVYSGRPDEIHIDRSTMMVLMDGLTKFHHVGLLFHIDFDAVSIYIYTRSDVMHIYKKIVSIKVWCTN